MVDPFVQYPTPWTSEYNKEEQRWYIIDAVGNDIFVANRWVEIETINFVTKAINTMGNN